MPSEDSKAVRKEERGIESNSEEEEDEQSLSAILKDCKSKPTNNTKPKSKTKQEPQDSDFHKPIRNTINGSRSKPKNQPKYDHQDDDDDDDDDDKPILRRTSNATKPNNKSSLALKRMKEEEEKNKKAETEKKKREKKVYDLPGQKRDPPEEREPLRIFYETLLKQKPNSEMAKIWMMESGLLPLDEAKKVFEKKQKKNQLQRYGTPIKSPAPAKRNTDSTGGKKRNTNSAGANKRNTVDSSKKSTETKNVPKQSKKRKAEDGSSGDDSDDDFVISSRITKKQKPA